MKIAEALVLRKHLEQKVKQLEPLKMNGDKGLFELRTERRPVGENSNVDEIVNQIPKVTLENITAEYDKYSKALRLLDTKIQETNWLTDIDYSDEDLNI